LQDRARDRMTKSSLPPRKVRCFVFVRRAAGDDDDGRAEGRRLPTAPWPRGTASTTADPSYLLASSPPAASPRSCTARTAVRDDPVFRCPGKRRSAVPCRAHWPLPTATSTDQITVSPSPPRLAGRWAYVYVRARSAGAAVRAGTRRGGRPGRPPPRRCHRAASATTARSPPGAPCPARAEPGMGRLAPWLPACTARALIHVVWLYAHGCVVIASSSSPSAHPPAACCRSFVSDASGRVTPLRGSCGGRPGTGTAMALVVAWWGPSAAAVAHVGS
jgi:hypothetical protein